VGLLDRISAARGAVATIETRNGIDQWLNNYLIPAFSYNGMFYSAGTSGLVQTLAGNKASEISATLPGYTAAVRQTPPAFAAQMVRALVLSQARFRFRNRSTSKTPKRMFGTSALSILEQPWPNGTTGELVSRMEWHAGLAGNAYVAYQPARRGRAERLRVLRPDWCALIYGSDQEPEDAALALDGELIGLVYQNGGLNQGGNKPQTILVGSFAHWAPMPDPLNAGIGMSWLTPAIRELQADQLAAQHKINYFSNGATPNLVVKGLAGQNGQPLTPAQFNEIVDMMESKHAGVANAYRCLHPETDVAMWDGPPVRADAVKAGDRVVAWADGRPVPGVVAAAEWQAPSPIVTVTTQRGRVIKTNDRHPFLLKDGSWVQAIDLNYGDLLVTGLGWATEEGPQDSLTPYQAWVLGVIVGDGCTIADTPTVSAWNEGIRTRLEIGHVLHPTGKGHDYRILGARALCVDAGIMYKRSYEKRVPPQVMTGSAKVKAAFLSGLIDTDGHVADPALRRSCEVGITSTSRGLLADAQHLLASLGVNASLSLSMPAGGSSGGAHGEGPRVRDAWRLIALGNDQARRLNSMLDLACAEKSLRLGRYAKTPSREDRSRFDRVVSVEVGEPEPTIGIEIAEHHTHVTGGVVTHNTLYLTAGADATVIGNSLQQVDFKATIGAGETRIAVLSRVPASLLGISEGLAGSSLNAGNFSAARRMFADTWVYPSLQDLAASLAAIVKVPGDAELWFDVGDMPVLREDAKDAADITLVQMQAIEAGVRAGYDPDNLPEAVVTNDLTKLTHTGLTSVQMQPPGATPVTGQSGTGA